MLIKINLPEVVGKFRKVRFKSAIVILAMGWLPEDATNAVTVVDVDGTVLVIVAAKYRHTWGGSNDAGLKKNASSIVRSSSSVSGKFSGNSTSRSGNVPNLSHSR